MPSMTPPPRTSDTEYTVPFNKAFDDIRKNTKTMISNFNKILATVKKWA
jgi:hypothetical protein